MQATAVLKEEHDVIERVLTMLETTVERLREGRKVPEEFAV
jgi:hemerythrin-like domain-containing protein